MRSLRILAESIENLEIDPLRLNALIRATVRDWSDDLRSDRNQDVSTKKAKRDILKHRRRILREV